jgi:uncharacterized membrane protein
VDLQELLTTTAERAALGIEFAALAWLVAGILVSLIACAVGLPSVPRHEAYHRLRRRLARVTLLGLELLVAADIVETIAARPTYASLGVLALIILIRTFLSFALEVEIEGRWPWARPLANESSGAER